MNIYRMAFIYAEQLDIQTNHLYDGKPYKIHLDMVEAEASLFIHLIPVEDRNLVRAAIRCHDVIEDDRASYNDVFKHTNETVADIVFAVTNETGKTRSDRANEKYYVRIRSTRYATFVKLCDRIANVKYGKENNNKYKMYEKEHYHFKRQLYDEKYADMFAKIESFF